MKSVNIGICGLGVVGAGTFNLLFTNRDTVNAHANRDLQVSRVGARRDNPACDLGNTVVDRDVLAVADSDVDIVVELIGGTTIAKELVFKAIANGKHIVTANKALIAEYGNEIFAAAQSKGVQVAYEAAVAGGIPIIKALREGLAANQVEWLAGIINGTGNFILTEIRNKGRAFADVLTEAQALGYAEADPTFDVEGIDAAHKLVILASLAFGMPLRFDAVYTEGIAAIDSVDVVYAEELGYRIKHLGLAKRSEQGIELRVHPTLIPESCLIAQVDGVMNAVMVKGDAVGPTLYYGAGAGAGPTASAVVADLIDVARSLDAPSDQRVSHLGFAENALNDLPILDIKAADTAAYFRASVLDKPGVLSSIAQIMSNHGISIEAIIQKEPHADEDHVPLIMLTNQTSEENLLGARRDIEQLDTVNGKLVYIRVESLHD